MIQEKSLKIRHEKEALLKAKVWFEAYGVVVVVVGAYACLEGLNFMCLFTYIDYFVNNNRWKRRLLSWRTKKQLRAESCSE